MAEVRNCERCGGLFEPRREHARFCSSRCRVAWNREHRRELKANASALDWAIIGMRDTAQRLGRVRARDRAQAFAAISEAVWWVTIVDATLVRYHPETYDSMLAAQTAAERRATEQTFTGLRFVRNWMGYHADHADFIQPQPQAHGGMDARITAWTWKPVRTPALGTLSPRGQAWEMDRYEAYQAQLAGHTIGETFQRATRFLTLTSEQATPAEPAGAHAE